MLARIHVGDANAAVALTRALGEAYCLAIQRNALTVDVLSRASELGGDEQARMELTFFLKAWAANHPGASPRVDW
jgi:hypothetical protein